MRLSRELNLTYCALATPFFFFIIQTPFMDQAYFSPRMAPMVGPSLGSGVLVGGLGGPFCVRWVCGGSRSRDRGKRRQGDAAARYMLMGRHGIKQTRKQRNKPTRGHWDAKKGKRGSRQTRGQAMVSGFSRHTDRGTTIQRQGSMDGERHGDKQARNRATGV